MICLVCGFGAFQAWEGCLRGADGRHIFAALSTDKTIISFYLAKATVVAYRDRDGLDLCVSRVVSNILQIARVDRQRQQDLVSKSVAILAVLKSNHTRCE